MSANKVPVCKDGFVWLAHWYNRNGQQRSKVVARGEIEDAWREWYNRTTAERHENVTRLRSS